MQSETRGVQSFGAKSDANAAKPRPAEAFAQTLCTQRAAQAGPQPSSPKINLKTLNVLFRTREFILSNLIVKETMRFEVEAPDFRMKAENSSSILIKVAFFKAWQATKTFK